MSSRSRHPLTLALALAALFLAGSLPAFAQRTLNHGVHAVPALGKVAVDGDLGEWDLSGSIVCTKDVATLLDTESARVAAMWDRDNLYVGILWRDSTPLMNRVDPKTMAGNGWRSDCVQLRCAMDGLVSHLDCWYYTPGKRPAMTINYGKIGAKDGGQPKVDRPANPEQLGAEQAFRVSPDGRGYVQEMKLPWAVLTLDGKMPAKDADLRLGIELFWGSESADGWPKSRVTDNLADGQTQTDFFWQNDRIWGRLVLDERNNLQLPAPAWLRAKVSEPRGPVPISFTLARESYVTIAIEDEQGNRVNSLLGGVKLPAGPNTVTWSGLDDRNRPVPAGRYRWKGLTRDAIELRWKMSFYQPNQRTPWNNVSGTGAWGPDHGCLITAAAGGGRVYLGGLGAEAGNPLFACSEEGEKLWNQRSGEPDHLAFVDGTLYAYTSTKDSNWLGITPNGVMQFDAQSGQWLDLPGRDGKPTRRLALLVGDEVAAGFTADREGLYLSVKGKGLIRAFDRTTFAEKHAYPLPDAGEIFAAGNGRLLALTPTALVELDPATGEARALAQRDFSAARALTADAKGRLYVALGAPDHQVLVFQRAGARTKLIRVLGKRGGRTQNGWYNPREGFRTPCGLAVDGQGRLWVTEESQLPKRVSVWRDGKWERDFIGDTAYGGGGVINPLDPTEAFYRGMVFKIDLDKGTYALKQVGLVLPPNAAQFGLTKVDEGLFSSATEYAVACRGRAYVLRCRDPRQIYRKRADGRWMLCVHIDPKARIAWIDRNDDGVIQESEVVRGGDAHWGGGDYWGMRPSQNLDQFFADGATGLRLRCPGFTKGGTPLYDLARFEPMAMECQNGIGLRDGSYNSGCQGERGEYFSEMRRTYPAGTPRRTFWFRGENTGRWTYRLPAPGLVLYPFQAHGVADVPSLGGEVVCWVSDFGQRYLFTDDMLYIDQLFQDGRSDYQPWPDKPKPGFLGNRMAPGQESFDGYFTRLQDGRYLLTTGFTDCRVFEVKGLDSLRRMDGEVALKPEDLARAEEIRRFRQSGGSGAVQAAVARTAAPLSLDGGLEGWPAEGAVRITVDEARGARVLTAAGADALYVAWDVRDATPLTNGAKRLETAFKGGDAVDLMFRQPGEKPDDPQVRAGDLRLLLTLFEGRPRAVLYRPVSASKRPYSFDAFEGAARGNAVPMDEVRPADEVRMRVTKGKVGYVVKAAIPWALLGGRPQPGAEARIDFGVLFGDPTGMQTVVRAYWSNRDTNIVADIPSEARLQPGNWGVCRFE